MVIPGQERTEKQLRILHNYFMKENQFMIKIREKKDEYETFRLYRALQLKIYDHNACLCEVGDIGDSFYIIIKGECGVLNPSTHDLTYPDYF